MMELSQFAKDYLTLGLRINKHIDGYVEHYFGPHEIKSLVDSEDLISPKRLLKDCLQLYNQLPKQEFDNRRENFLEKTLNAILTTLKTINGEKVSYLSRIEAYFDFFPKIYDDDFFFELKAKADEVYQGEGTLFKKMKEYSQKRVINPNDVMKLSKLACKIAKNKCMQKFPNLLPEQEKVEITDVENQSWLMYNWYLGNFNSRMEINISRTHYWSNLLFLMCHEIYPGHHTEAVVKDQYLFRDKSFFESTILIVYTPEMVIHEGIGDVAERELFTPKESAKILLDRICPSPDLEDDVEIIANQISLKNDFKKIECNLAYNKYVNDWSDERLLKYAINFEIYPEIGVKEMIKFISDDLWGPYVFTYQGIDLITENYGYPPPRKIFYKILSEQIIPSRLL